MSNRPPDAGDPKVPAKLDAGLSPQQIDAMLAQMRSARTGRADGLVTLPSLLGRWRVVGLLAFVVACAAMVLLQRESNRVAVSAISARTVEESVLLQCLTPEEAAEIVRPLLAHEWNAVVVNPESSPGRVRLRGRTFELSRAKAELAKFEGDGGADCPVAPVSR